MRCLPKIGRLSEGVVNYKGGIWMGRELCLERGVVARCHGGTASKR